MSQYQIYITASTLPSTHPNQSVFPFTIASFPQVVRNKINNNVAIGAGFNDPDNFTGEVLNIDALTGGFNFQAAWTTGWIVGSNIMK